jgi:hypothetical protein
MPTESAPRRRAAKVRACADVRSSHWKSSIRHSSGSSVATCDSRLSTARPMRNPSGAGPVLRPKVVRSASRWGAGRASRCASSGPHSWCSPAKGSSISEWTPTARTTWHPGACPARYSSSAVLPTPASPCSTSTRLSPPPTDRRTRSSTPHSACRPVRPGVPGHHAAVPGEATKPTVPPESRCRPTTPSGGPAEKTRPRQDGEDPWDVRAPSKRVNLAGDDGDGEDLTRMDDTSLLMERQRAADSGDDERRAELDAEVLQRRGALRRRPARWA